MTTNSVDGSRAETTESELDVATTMLMARGIATLLGYKHSEIELIELFPWGITVHTRNGFRKHFKGRVYG